MAAIVVISGSDGGIEFPDKLGIPLAEKGFAVLALPYWKYKDLPDKLSQIPLEYFFKAIEILKTEPIVDQKRIGIIGFSRGGECALLLASKSKDIKAVVALSPGAYLAPNIDFRDWWNLKAAWTLNGTDLPFIPKKRKVKEGDWGEVFKQIKARRNRDSLIADFNELKSLPEFEESAIKVENIGGPILLVSGGLDLLWSAESMSDYMTERLKKSDYPYYYDHLNYPKAGHDFITLGFLEYDNEELLKKYVENEYPPGGNIDDNIEAGKQSWISILSFLNEQLKHSN